MTPHPPRCEDPALRRVIRSEFPENPRAVRLVETFLRHRRAAHPGFVGELFALARSPTEGGPDQSWETRRLAALMLQQQFLRLPREDEEGALEFLARLGLLAEGRVTDEVLKEGYTTTEPSAFLSELRRHLGRPVRVLAPLARDCLRARALRDFLVAARQECLIALARYLLAPAEVAGRILAQVRRSSGTRATMNFRYSDGEARRRIARLPGFEAVLVRALHENGGTFWAGPRTGPGLNAMVEQPLGTVVVTIKPPGSRVEIEIKRAGRPSALPLGIVHDRDGAPVPPSHRLDGGSVADTLQWEAGQSACLARLYRLIHRSEAPISITTSITTPDTLPVGDEREVELIAYFTDPTVFGDGFAAMRGALRRSIVSLKGEQGKEPPDLAGDEGETRQFFHYGAPAQSILVGSTSFRIDLLARYLAPDGADDHFERGRGSPPTCGEARRFADAVLDEVLGRYRPPRPRPRPGPGAHGAYIEAAFARPENRAQSDRVHASLTGQLGTFWGTMLALRGYSFGESFVARNVGLRTVWEGGRWRVRIIFMDHDNLHLPVYIGDVFDPYRSVSAMINDETHLLGRETGAGHLPGTVDHLRAIYRVNDDTAARHSLRLARSLAKAYRKTHRRLRACPALARMIPSEFLTGSLAWDAAVSLFLRAGAEGPGAPWSEAAGAVLKARGLADEVVTSYLGSIEHFAPFLQRYAYLFDVRTDFAVGGGSTTEPGRRP